MKFLIVIVHDVNYFPNQPWPEMSGPPTLLGSNFEGTFPEVDYSKPITAEN